MWKCCNYEKKHTCSAVSDLGGGGVLVLVEVVLGVVKTAGGATKCA